MSDEKDLIKQRTDLIDLVGEYVKLTKAGSNYKGLCPFHNEKTPSFYVHPEMGIFKCFGCGESGDCFSWLMKMENLTFPEALQELAKRAGIKLTKFKPDLQSRNREQILQALSFAREFYHWLLTQHPIGKPALQYIKQRGISDSAIKTFMLGWSPNDWDGLQRYLINKKGFHIQTLIKAGLVVPKSGNQSGYDRFRGRVMFPLQNVRGQTLGFSGRIIEGVTQGSKDVGKYINTPETEVYHKRELLYGLEITKPEIKTARQVVVVEGELDLISSWQANVKHIVAIKGSALTAEQVAILKRYTDTLILALDMDIAGDKAAHRGIQTAEAAGLEVKVVKIVGGKDPDEVAQTNPQAWQNQIKSAIDVYQFLLDSAVGRFGTQTATAKRKIAQELLPIWAEISSSIVQAHWVARLAQRLDVKEDTIWQEMQKNPKVQTRAVPIDKAKETFPAPAGIAAIVAKKPRRQQLEELLTAHFLQTDILSLLKPEIKNLIKTIWIKQLQTYFDSINQQVLELQLPSNQPDSQDQKLKSKPPVASDGQESTSLLPITIYQLKEKIPIPEEFQPNVAEVLMLIDIQDTDKYKYPEIINSLLEINLKEQLHVLRQQIAELEKKHQPSKLAQAHKKFSYLSSQLAKHKGKQV